MRAQLEQTQYPHRENGRRGLRVRSLCAAASGHTIEKKPRARVQ